MLLMVLTLMVVQSEVHAALLAIDLGGEHLTNVAISPGSSPITVVTNEMSQRKSPAVVTFKPPNGDRLLGEEAHAYGAKHPQSAVYFSKELLGVPSSEARASLDRRSLPVPTELDQRRGTARITAAGTNHTSEEIAAMLFTYCRRIAESHAQQPITDAVVAVPPQFGQQQRKALFDAAQLADLSILGLVNDHAAAAVQFGIDRRELGMNSSQEVALVDVGGTSTSAALVRYSSFGSGIKQKVPQVEVLAEAWEDNAGGADLDETLARHFAHEVEAKYGISALTDDRAFAKLRRQAKRTKEMLSANKEASINVESLADGVDFASSITREEFEQLVDPIASLASKPLADVLSRSKDSGVLIELVGGSSRVPIIQNKLQEAAGSKRELGMHMNADEAIAWGAGLFAANLSTIFKVRNYGLMDAAPYPIEATVDGGASDEAVEAGNGASASEMQPNAHTILPQFKHLPVKRKLTARDKHADFDVDLHIGNGSARLPRGQQTRHIRRYAIMGLRNAEAQHNSTGEVHMHFAVDKGGIVTLPKAELVVNIVEAFNVAVNDTSVSGTVSGDQDQQVNASSSNGNSSGKESGDNELGEQSLESDEASNRTQTAYGDPNSSGTKMRYEEKTVTRRGVVPLNVVVHDEFLPSMGAAEMAQAKQELRKLDDVDRRHERASKAKSELENFVYKSKAALEEDGEWHRVISESAQQELARELNEIGDWAEMEGSDASAEEFEERLESLRSKAAPVQHRASELVKRPKAIESAKAEVQTLKNEIQSWWPTTLPQVNETERLELMNELERLRGYVEQCEASQSEKALFDEPAFNSTDISHAHARVRSHVNYLKKKPPLPPQSPTSEEGDEHNSSEPSDSYKTSSEEDGEENGQLERDEGGGGATGGAEQPYDEL